jgi:hypothetical protein
VTLDQFHFIVDLTKAIQQKDSALILSLFKDGSLSIENSSKIMENDLINIYLKLLDTVGVNALTKSLRLIPSGEERGKAVFLSVSVA